MSEPLVTVKNVVKNFPGREEPVLRSVSLEMYPGEFSLVTGRSGSGKSTLLNCIAGLETFDTGSIQVAGIAIEKGSIEQLAAMRLEHLGIVFQFFNLIPSLTLHQNILLPGRLAGKSIGDLTTRAEELITYVGIQDVVHQLPEVVSGGEAQRAAIARALLLQPKIILADEPTGNLDEENASSIIQLFQSLTKEHQVALCLVSHNPEYRQMSDRTFSFQKGSLQREV